MRKIVCHETHETISWPKTLRSEFETHYSMCGKARLFCYSFRTKDYHDDESLGHCYVRGVNSG